MSPALSIHLAITWMIVGFIWTIQVIVYPQMLRVNSPEFKGYHFAHCFRVGFLVVPLCLGEAVSAAWLLWQGHREPLLVTSFALIPLNWLLTATMQAPMHTRLMHGFDEAIIRRLILSNWLRTLVWSARGVLLMFAVISP